MFKQRDSVIFHSGLLNVEPAATQWLGLTKKFSSNFSRNFLSCCYVIDLEI